jgi:hypothetical protein
LKVPRFKAVSIVLFGALVYPRLGGSIRCQLDTAAGAHHLCGGVMAQYQKLEVEEMHPQSGAELEALAEDFLNEYHAQAVCSWKKQ